MKDCTPKAKSKNQRKAPAKGLPNATRTPKDYPWKVLGSYVNAHEHVFSRDELDLLTQIIRDRDVDAYLELETLWGLQIVNSIPRNSEIHDIRVKYQVCSMLKKYQFPTSKQIRLATAKQKFRNAEDACEEFNRCGYLKLVAGKTEYEAELLTYVQAFLRKVLGETLPSFTVLSEWARHGPGSSTNTVKGYNSKYDKYKSWPYPCTRLAIPYARLLIEKDKRWLGALEDDYRTRFNIPKWAILNREVFWENVLYPQESNQICFVPKNALTERTIAKEPPLNLMLQLGVDGFIRRRLKRWGTDLDDQEKNQRLAGYGSCDDSKDGFVTIDLKAASDSIALKLAEIVLPPAWYDYLIKIRCPGWVFDQERDRLLAAACNEAAGGYYHKISSMGNGFTFALESAIFAAAIYAVMKAERGVTDTELFSVYGDDLIVQKKYAQGVIDLLSRMGFGMNTDKSFVKGPVRESCGADWFNGSLIRPVFIKEPPTSVKMILNDLNRLYRSSVLYDGEADGSTRRMMLKWIPDVFKTYEFYGPCSDTEFDTYIHSPVPLTEWKRGTWKYVRVVTKTTETPARNFGFRKLMHDLRPVDPIPNPWEEDETPGGNRFTVPAGKARVVSKVSSRTDTWCGDYHFTVPSIRRP